uniref:Proteasome 20S subunit beta 7 n=1 Tax=Oncorhynchus tshawytscha TaxID=74940 RepID=A0A8C8G6G4_ONCTS
MSTLSVCQTQPGGFRFENSLVDILAGNICGIDGLVLGADTRATEGMIVAPLCRVLCPSCCCGAGTAADTAMTTQIISSNLELHSLSTGRLPRVATANHMLKQMLFRYQGHIGAALVLGGMDCNGPHLYSIYPHGSTDKLPYVTMGESEEDAKRLVRDAIAAGIFNDLGSGSNIDLCVITNGRVDYLRPHDMANKKGGALRYPMGWMIFFLSIILKKCIAMER